jgi:choloylglycine hydrolase
MKKHLSGIIFIILCICLAPVTGQPCTAFVLDNGTALVSGKNSDWVASSFFLMINKRGVSKTAIAPSADTPMDELLAWTSKYGSVTSTRFGREWPSGGMNEAGLVIQALMLKATRYPDPDERPELVMPQWIQYQLDTASTVEEVIKSDGAVRIAQLPQQDAKVHYFITDSLGNNASIEWIDGKMVCHTGDDLPVKVLANNSYDQSLAVLRRFQGFGGYMPISLSRFLIQYQYNSLNNSLPRFVYAAEMSEQYKLQNSKSSVDYAFDVLSLVAQPKHASAQTQLSAVYDISNRSVYFHTLENSRIRYFNLSAFDFSCATPVKVLDIFEDLSGDVSSSFIDFTEQMGRDLLKSNFPSMADETLEELVAYPGTYTSCTDYTDNTTEDSKCSSLSTKAGRVGETYLQ